MKIRKRMVNKIPTVQYGNLDLETSVEFDSAVDGELTVEVMQAAVKDGKRLDKLVGALYTTLRQELESAHLDAITEDFPSGKKQKKK